MPPSCFRWRPGRRAAIVAVSLAVNIVRDPRWGRAFESIGEDPYLAGQLSAADIRGVQSAGPRQLTAPVQAGPR